MNLADWTVDKLLTEFRAINERAGIEHQRLRDNRARYMEVVRSLGSVPDPTAKANLKAKLTTWIHNQVAAENRFNGFASKWTAVKNGIKGFLQQIHVQPPAYLGQFEIAVVPAALIGLLIAAGAVVTVVALANRSQGQALNNISNVLAMAKEQHWSAREVDEAMSQITSSTKAASPSDALGLGKALEAALPIVLLVAAIVLVPKLLPQRASA